MIFQESSIFFHFSGFLLRQLKRAHHLQFQKQHLYSSYLNGSGRSQRLENSKYIDCRSLEL